MRFPITALVAATAGLLLTGGITVASAVDAGPVSRPVGFVAPADPAVGSAHPGAVTTLDGSAPGAIAPSR